MTRTLFGYILVTTNLVVRVKASKPWCNGYDRIRCGVQELGGPTLMSGVHVVGSAWWFLRSMNMLLGLDRFKCIGGPQKYPQSVHVPGS